MLQISSGPGLSLQGVVRSTNLGVDWGISKTISRHIPYPSLLLLDIFDISPSESGFTQSLASFVAEGIPSCQMKHHFSGQAKASRRERVLWKEDPMGIHSTDIY